MRLRIFYFYLEKRVLFYTIEECKHIITPTGKKNETKM